jgi:rhodanese-related sulfurtransferase
MSGCGESTTVNKAPLVINVLDKALYDDCHIPGSVHVNFDAVEYYVSTMPRDREIIVYCSNYACSTSHFVAQKLIDAGYTNVWVYAAGMAGWFLAGYPVEGPAEASYLHKELSMPDELGTLPTVSTQKLAERLKMV